MVVHPAPGTAEGVIPVFISVIEQNLDRVAAPVGKGFFHLGLGGKPVVMVALQNNFGAIKLMKVFKIRPAFLHNQSPGNIPRDDDGIFGLYRFLPVFGQALHIVFPAGKNIHRLIDP